MIAAIRVGRVAISLLVVCIILFVKELTDSQILLYYAANDPETMASFAFWYVAFNITNVSAILGVYIAHRTIPVGFCLAARVFIYYCLLSSAIIFIRGIEQVYFLTEHLKTLYLSVRFLNYGFIFFLGYSLYQAYKRSKEFEERIAWNI